jgi:Flp pilus assembly protein TadG
MKMEATTEERGTHLGTPFGTPTAFLSRKIQRGRQAGSSLIELAILAPVLILLLVGVMDFARVYYYGIVAANAARAGAQYGIEGNNTDTTGMVNHAALDANASCNNVSPAAAGCSSGSLSSFGATTAGNQANCLCPTVGGAWVSIGTAPACTATPCPYDGSAPRVYVEVDSSYPFNPLFRVFPNSIGLSGKAAMRAEYAHPARHHQGQGD